jgi:nucleoside-diphosphate-sugar epimerase
LDNLSTGKRENLSAVRDGIDFLEGDLRDPQIVRQAVQGIDCVFHQAALRSVPRSLDDPASTNEVNITGTLKLLLACRDGGVKRLVYASSSSIYGDNRHYPQAETLRPSPLSPYAVSKLAAEHYSLIFTKTFGLETVSLRYFNVFGPRQDPKSQYAAVIPSFMQAARNGQALEVHGDGRQSRDFTYIDNVVEANLLAAATSGIAGECFNIAGGKSISLLELIGELERLTGRPLERRHTAPRAGDVRKTWADIRKAKKSLRYKPQVDFREGLRRTWDWFGSAEH